MKSLSLTYLKPKNDFLLIYDVSESCQKLPQETDTQGTSPSWYFFQQERQYTAVETQHPQRIWISLVQWL